MVQMRGIREGGKEMKERFELAQEKFQNGFNCSQSVLFALGDLLQLDEKEILNISRGFGAGMGRKEEVCGAVTGGIMALGLYIGASDKDENSKREETYAHVQNFMNEFYGIFKSYICRELLDGCDLNTEAGKLRFKEKEMKKNVCMNCVGESVKIIERIIGKGE